MSRRQRIRIVMGMIMFLAGLAISFVAPAICFWHYSAQMKSTEIESIFAMMQAATRLSMALQLSGCALATIGLLTTFIQWACWFIGPRNPAANPDDR